MIEECISKPFTCQRVVLPQPEQSPLQGQLALVRCRELGNPLGNELSNLFAGNKPALIRSEDATINRGDGVIVHLDLVGANHGIDGSGFSHALMVAPQVSKHNTPYVGLTLQLLGSRDPSEQTIKRTEWQVPRLPGKLQHQAVGESQGGTRAEELERHGNGVRILQCQVLVFKQHLDARSKLGDAEFVNS